MTGDATDREPILLYDERCSVCRRFIAILIGADRTGHIRIAPLQGARGEWIRKTHPEFSDRDSAVWVPPKGPPVGYSDAILAALRHVGGGWRMLARACRLVPRGFRNRVYRAFARNRRYFGWLGLAELDERSRQRLLDQSGNQ